MKLPIGYGGRGRTCECRSQSAMPCLLATPYYFFIISPFLPFVNIQPFPIRSTNNRLCCLPLDRETLRCVERFRSHQTT